MLSRVFSTKVTALRAPAGALALSHAAVVHEQWNLPVFPDQVYAPLTAHVGDSLVLSWVNEHNVVVMPARAPAPLLLFNAQVIRCLPHTQQLFQS